MRFWPSLETGYEPKVNPEWTFGRSGGFCARPADPPMRNARIHTMMCILIRIGPILHSDSSCRKNVLLTQNLLYHFIPDGLIHKQQCQSSSAFVLPAELHTGDIDVALSENCTDLPDDARPVVVH